MPEVADYLYVCSHNTFLYIHTYFEKQNYALGTNDARKSCYVSDLFVEFLVEFIAFP